MSAFDGFVGAVSVLFAVKRGRSRAAGWNICVPHPSQKREGWEHRILVIRARQRLG